MRVVGFHFKILKIFRKSGDNQNDSFEAAPKYVKHISKSASELSHRDGTKAAAQEKPIESPQRARGAINPAVSGVLQRTHGFFSTLKVNCKMVENVCSKPDFNLVRTKWQHRWSRGRSKERMKQQSIRDTDGDEFDSDATDYAADNSSDSATQSPRHRPVIGGSPLARTDNRSPLARNKSDSITTQQSLVMNTSIDLTHQVAGGSKDTVNDPLVSKNIFNLYWRARLT